MSKDIFINMPQKKRNGKFIVEKLHVVKVGEHYRIESVPVYSNLMCKGDIITIKKMEGEFWLDDIIESSDNSTIRIEFLDMKQRLTIMFYLADLGCESHCVKKGKVCSLNVPGSLDFKVIDDYLQKFEDQRVINYGTGAYRHLFDFPEERQRKDDLL
jgi:hypothetical protein